MIFETHSRGNSSSEYWHNSLNQQIRKLDDGKDSYDFSFDLRGNLVQGVYHQNRNHSYIIEAYVYDATNRMVKGINVEGEESHYIYNGLGHLVANEWVIEKNNYGYTGVETDPSERVGVVVVCDRHVNSTGQGHINPTGKGHTTGGTTGGSIPAIHNKFAIVHKDYVLDYTSPLANVIMEYESGASGLTYRYTYGLMKNNVVIYGIPNGVGSVVQNFTYPGGTERVVKLYYHHDRLGSTHYLTDNVDAKVTSFTAYDDWGSPTMKAVLRLGERELDLVTEFTGHPYDPIMGVYYAKARMYDAGDRRFMAVDPWKGMILNSQSLIQYTYVLNNPIKYVDPFGLKYTIVEGLTAHLMISAYVKSQYSTAIIGPYINGVSHTASGRGFADIIWEHDGFFEVYEIKSVQYRDGLYSGSAAFQLCSYVAAINSNPLSAYRPAIFGQSMSNLNNKYLLYPLDPQKLIKITTSFSSEPGMIYYEIVTRGRQAIQSVNLSSLEANRIETFRKMACEEKSSVFAVDTGRDEEFFEQVLDWLEGVRVQNINYGYYTFTQVYFPDNTVRYSYIGLSVFYSNSVPKARSPLELMNIYVGYNSSIVGEFTSFLDTNWDPVGLQAIDDFFSAPWPSELPKLFPVPFPIPPVRLPVI